MQELFYAAEDGYKLRAVYFAAVAEESPLIVDIHGGRFYRRKCRRGCKAMRTAGERNGVQRRIVGVSVGTRMEISCGDTRLCGDD